MTRIVRSDMQALVRVPSAWLPFVLSLVALVMVVGYAVAFGVADHQDEGTPARLFQLLMAVQAIVIGHFAVRWLPRESRTAAPILVLQIIAASIPVAAIVLLESTAA
jgi:hypothetical protein